jgi:type IV pilus assembly protein PilW
MNTRNRNCDARGERGMSLVELMVAMALGLVLTVGMTQVYLGNRATYAFNDGLSLIQENARFAIDHVADNVRMAGFRGCLSDVAVQDNLSGAANPFRDDIANGIGGYNAKGTSTGDDYAAGATDPAPLDDADAWSPALPDELSAPARVLPGSDVLVIRNVSGTANALVSPFSDANVLDVAAPVDFLPGEILVATDCQKVSIFQVTDVQPSASGATLSHSADPFTPGNAVGAWDTNQSYGLGSEVSRLEAVAYYVGRGENGSPSLFQLRLQRTDATTSSFQPEELVEGIDTMQVRYGLDTDANRQVDTWQTADEVAAANSWGDVLSVEISLLTRASEEHGTEFDTATYNIGGVRFDPVNDRRLRQVFATTIGVRNRLP